MWREDVSQVRDIALAAGHASACRRREARLRAPLVMCRIRELRSACQRLALQGGQQGRRGWTRGVRVLACDQEAVGDDVNAPVCRFREDGAELQHFVFDQEGHYLSEADVLLFTVGETGHLLALDQWLAAGRLDVAQRASRVAHD